MNIPKAISLSDEDPIKVFTYKIGQDYYQVLVDTATEQGSVYQFKNSVWKLRIHCTASYLAGRLGNSICLFDSEDRTDLLRSQFLDWICLNYQTDQQPSKAS